MQATKEIANAESETEDLKFSRRDFGTTEYNGKKSVVKKGKTVYNEGRTIAMQWAYHPDTKVGDTRTVLLDGKYSVIKATKTDDGYVLIKYYSEKEYDQYYAHGMANRVYGSSDGQRLSDRGRGAYFSGIRNEGEYEEIDRVYEKGQRETGNRIARTLERSGEDTGSGERSGTVNYQARDSDYLSAVERGDMETAQRMVDDAAKEAGFTVKAYHGTISFGFTKPDVSKGDQGLSMYATSTVDTADSYSYGTGVRKISSDNPEAYYPENEYEYDLNEAIYQAYSILLNNGNLDEWALDSDEIRRIIKDKIEYDEYHPDDLAHYIEEELSLVAYEAWKRIDPEEHDGYEDYDEWAEETENGQNLTNDIADVSEKISSIQERFDNSFTDGSEDFGVYDLFINTDGFLEIDAHYNDWNEINYNGKRTSTRELEREYAGKYPGIVIHNVYDSGGRGTNRVSSSDVYIMYHPEQQAKSADAVTYDDEGNVIPISQRFNPGNEDIRYQSRAIDEDPLYPNSQRERSAFDRSMANKTSDLKDGDVRRIIINTADNAYFVIADGYMTGEIYVTVPIDGNEDFLKDFTEDFKNGTYQEAESDDILFESIRSNRRRGIRNYADAEGQRREARQNERVDEESYGGEYGRSDRGSSQDLSGTVNRQYRSSSMPSDIDILIEASEDVKNNKAGNFSQNDRSGSP